MTEDQAVQQMAELAKISRGDPEAAHAEADKLLCDFLKGLGYNRLVAAFDDVDAWYA